MALKLNLNEPVLLSLSRPDPKRLEHEGGRISFMYSVVLQDGTQEKMFLTPDCSQSLQEMKIAAHQPFAICRRKTPQRTDYVEIVLQTPAKSVPAPVAPQPQAVRKPVASAPTSHTHASSVMGAALIAAIDAASLAQEYAASKGLALEFGPEDYRAIAATLYIAASRDPRYSEAA